MPILEEYRIRLKHLQSQKLTARHRRRLTAIGGGMFVVAALTTAVMLQDTQDTAPPDFTVFDQPAERKDAFFAYFLPIIEQQNQQLLSLRRELELFHLRRQWLSLREQWHVETIAADYGIEDFEARTPEGWDILFRRVDIVPPSLALAQAANESAWGTSRFALEANNYYGHWCFVPGCGLVPSARPAGARHEVAAFNSPGHSVQRYMHNINQHEAYTGLRMARSELRENGEPISGDALVDGLERYSERGQDYIEELRAMIRIDDLTRFDLQQHASLSNGSQ